MYLRFVITQINEDSHQSQGLFRAAGALLESGDLDAEDRQKLQDILTWFNKNLPAPDQAYIRGRVTFWFRSDAQECIQRMWSLVHILSSHNHLVELHKCEHLYNIIYRDDFQVAAFPHRLDGKHTVK